MLPEKPYKADHREIIHTTISVGLLDSSLLLLSRGLVWWTDLQMTQQFQPFVVSGATVLAFLCSWFCYKPMFGRLDKHLVDHLADHAQERQAL